MKIEKMLIQATTIENFSNRSKYYIIFKLFCHGFCFDKCRRLRSSGENRLMSKGDVRPLHMQPSVRYTRPFLRYMTGPERKT